MKGKTSLEKSEERGGGAKKVLALIEVINLVGFQNSWWLPVGNIDNHQCN